MRNYRYELKFTINKNMAEILKHKLKLIMVHDINGEDGKYFIRSLYFDDINSSAYYEKIDGVPFRKKYRIRIYNFESHPIRLECKYKNFDYTYKESTTINKQMCYNLINNDIAEIVTDDKFLNNFLTDMKTKKLKPSVIVDYKREAFTYPVSDVRVTFDSQVSSGFNNFNIFDENATSAAMINDNEVVLEVKFNEIIPNHIVLVLSSVPVVRQAFSKFAICRSIKE